MVKIAENILKYLYPLSVPIKNIFHTCRNDKNNDNTLENVYCIFNFVKSVSNDQRIGRVVRIQSLICRRCSYLHASLHWT